MTSKDANHLKLYNDCIASLELARKNGSLVNCNFNVEPRRSEAPEFAFISDGKRVNVTFSVLTQTEQLTGKRAEWVKNYEQGLGVHHIIRGVANLFLFLDEYGYLAKTEKTTAFDRIKEVA